MKCLVVVTFTMFLTISAAAQTTHVKFSQSGAFAQVSETTDPLSSFSLSVSMNSSTTTGTNTSLFYEAVSIASDFSSESFTVISGSIPDADFSAQNTQNVTLNVDVSTLDPTAAFAETCVLDLTTFNQTCTPLTSGTIQLTFVENGAQRTQILTLQEVITVGPVTTRIHQNSDNSSATATGTILGTQISTANATVGVNHNSSLESITTQ